ncbi:hypothetical protein P280DRAFT_471927 [Massarina eburnea CBS 473.64]|uniref:Uncharacterized protein n=1 Tax=Massarina eburnea CBS 473.64 TaxID=1395130 RepID=A0A6A6RU25_9PLEO|nr:hypothetical protein P280DRAFT_471927 [Massarina eburnea CBS 473.64]
MSASGHDDRRDGRHEDRHHLIRRCPRPQIHHGSLQRAYQGLRRSGHPADQVREYINSPGGGLRQARPCRRGGVRGQIFALFPRLRKGPRRHLFPSIRRILLHQYLTGWFAGWTGADNETPGMPVSCAKQDPDNTVKMDGRNEMDRIILEAKHGLCDGWRNFSRYYDAEVFPVFWMLFSGGRVVGGDYLADLSPVVWKYKGLCIVCDALKSCSVSYTRVFGFALC